MMGKRITPTPPGVLVRRWGRTEACPLAELSVSTGGLSDFGPALDTGFRQIHGRRWRSREQLLDDPTRAPQGARRVLQAATTRRDPAVGADTIERLRGADVGRC